MMRIIAAIYMAIALTNFWLWFGGPGEVELFPNPAAYLSWTLFVFTLLALFAFVIKRQILPSRAWQAVLAIYCVTRLYELSTYGITLSAENAAENLNILSGYLWMVLPPGMAMWHMAFEFRRPQTPSPEPAPSPPAAATPAFLPEDASQHGPLRMHYTEQLP